MGVILTLSLLGLLHIWFIPSDNIDAYLFVFATLYFFLTLSSLYLIFHTKKNWKIISIVSFVVAGCALAYDIFGIALGSMQF